MTCHAPPHHLDTPTPDPGDDREARSEPGRGPATTTAATAATGAAALGADEVRRAPVRSRPGRLRCLLTGPVAGVVIALLPPGPVAAAGAAVGRSGTHLDSVSATPAVVAPDLIAGAGVVVLAAADLPTVIGNITAWIVGLLVLVATLFLTYGGLRYVMAGGDPAEVDKAKSALKNALVGYALAILAPILLGIVQGWLGV